jgi:hypothetical protein
MADTENKISKEEQEKLEEHINSLRRDFDKVPRDEVAEKNVEVHRSFYKKLYDEFKLIFKDK